MKIKSIKFKKHNVFKGHIINFGDNNIPVISFLVGNNGSGKTRILEFISDVLTGPFNPPGEFEVVITILLSDDEVAKNNLFENEIIYTIKNINESRRERGHFINYKDGRLVSGLDMQNLSKVVFSQIEINFGRTSISSVTSKNIDNNPNPKEKSQNLSTEIPQLLVDIKNLDDADIAKWHNEHKKGYDGPFPSVGNRLKRFTEAFHKIYEGEKTFSEIKNDKGSKKIIFLDSNKEEIDINDLSTGEKQIIYRIGYILKDLANISGGIILIDEPEISLHPTWQVKLKDFLFDIFKDRDVQIIIATHSPYIFKNLNESREVCIKVNRSNPESSKISMVFPNVPYTPSVNLINYLAYGMSSEMLHIELYALLQIREGRDKVSNSWNKKNNSKNQDGIENWLRDVNGGNIPVRQTFIREGQSYQTEETIMTWVRNKIHHPDESARPNFTEKDLEDSINEMIRLLQNK